MTKSELWTLSEWQVARNRVFIHREELLHHRTHLGGIEIDLILREPASGIVTIVEVKTAKLALWDVEPLRPRQKGRLVRAAQLLFASGVSHVELKLAIVSHTGGRYLTPEIECFELDP